MITQQYSMERWRDKVAVVTGASSGIGAAISEQLLDAGVNVVGLARDVRKLKDIEKTLQNRKGKFFTRSTDVSIEDEVIEAFQWASKNVGKIGILINSAGIARSVGLITGESKHWKAVLDTNVFGLCLTTREAVKTMRENNVDGHIIHINSVLGHRVPNAPYVNVYAAAKHAVTALTETLRQELNSMGSKIKITSISPGLVDTEILNSCFDVVKIPRINNGNWKQIILQSSDVADAIMYILGTPPHVQIHELMLKPVGETF